MTKIYIVRHAEAEGNVWRRIHGHYDGRVTPNGRRQIECVAQRFRDLALANSNVTSAPAPTPVYSSDLTRAYETACGIADALGCEVTKLESLREIAMGAWEDTCWGYWETHAPELANAYNLKPMDWVVDGAEHISDVHSRMVQTTLELAERHSGGAVVLVTHGVALRTLLCHASGVTLDDVNEIRYCDNTAVSLLTADGGKLSIEYMNDNSHLPEELSTFAKQRWWKTKNITDKRNLYFKQIEGDELNLIAMHYGTPCGALELSVRDASTGTIESIWLEPEFRSQGFAIQLLGAAISAFRRRGLTAIAMSVDTEDSAALKFAQRNGFNRTAESDGKLAFTLPI
ncbi:MAG: GNAT family N-acetyltransferase [Oscillospiraceae bacterium]|jgi:probable phosphoglycerate mutase|nr:GNAT family N-acetyltransferase [Oscillospiraceae bacterium]